MCQAKCSQSLSSVIPDQGVLVFTTLCVLPLLPITGEGTGAETEWLHCPESHSWEMAGAARDAKLAAELTPTPT